MACGTFMMPHPSGVEYCFGALEFITIAFLIILGAIVVKGTSRVVPSETSTEPEDIDE